MMKIYVTSLENRPVGTVLEAMFGESGGSIGRSDTNTLILPDLQRVISRVHARIEYRGGGFVISNVGSNPITVRGRPLAQGETVPLFAGDELIIGNYTLNAQRADGSAAGHVAATPVPSSQRTVSIAPTPQPAPVAPPVYTPPAPAPVAAPAPVVAPAPPPIQPVAPPAPAADLGADPLGLFGSGVAPLASDANPFADLMGAPVSAPPEHYDSRYDPIPPTEILPPSHSSASPLAEFAAPAPAPAPAFASASPLGEFAAPMSSSASPFAEFASPAAASSSPLAEFAAPAPMMSAAPAGVIPDDFDPFADPLAPLPVAPPAPVGGDFDIITGTQPAESRDINALFDLGPTTGQDPFANSALAHDLLPHQDQAPVDPLVALGAAPAPVSTQTIPDQVAEIHGAFIPPAISIAPEPAQAPASVAAPVIPPPVASNNDQDMFFSLSNPASAGGASPETGHGVAPAPAPLAAPVPAPEPLPPFELGAGDFSIEPLHPQAPIPVEAPVPLELSGFVVEPLHPTPPQPEAHLPEAHLPEPTTGFIIEPLHPADEGFIIEPLVASPLPVAPVEPVAVVAAAPVVAPAAHAVVEALAEAPAPAAVPPAAPVAEPAPLAAPVAHDTGHPEISPNWPFAPTPDPAHVVPQHAPAAAAQASNDPLALAFLAGLGMQNSSLPVTITPEFMQRVGVLLREATQGTLDLLMARAMTKREVRADATIIVSRNNNPLKFSPDVAVALTHLVAPQGRGFLTPEDAMRDAYEDLRSHQFGFMAGLRAALADVLKRFDPTVLEQRLSKRTMLDSMLAINRRAKLWDLYTELYREIASEAEEDFHSLFGREFVRAYEEQVSRLKDKQG